MRLYHYTSAVHLPAILADGRLTTTDPNLFRGGPVSWINDTGEVTLIGGPYTGQPVVWLIDLPDVSLGHGLNFGGPREVDKRAYRLTVDVDDASPWLRWLTARRHDPTWVRTIVATGGGKKAARHWFVVPHPIERSSWAEVRDMAEDRVLWRPAVAEAVA